MIIVSRSSSSDVLKPRKRHFPFALHPLQSPQLDTVIKLLPRLQYGLDVNVRFNSVRGFEFTEEMAAFDMAGITLLHGWLLDPEDRRTVRALGLMAPCGEQTLYHAFPTAQDDLRPSAPCIVSVFSSLLQGQVIEGMSYNKLVEKLLDFRSAMTAASDEGNQDGKTARVGPSVACISAESRENGQQEESISGASTTEEETAFRPAQACGDDGAVAVGDKCGPLGENGASPVPISAHQEGSDSTLHRERTPSDACARATSGAIADEESAKIAMTLKEGQVAEDFFRETASQLTYYGLSRLHQEVRDVARCAIVVAVLRDITPLLLWTGYRL